MKIIKLTFVLLAIISCNNEKNNQGLAFFEKEINSEKFHTFKNILPHNHDGGPYLIINYSAILNGFGHAGANLMYSFSNEDFEYNREQLFIDNKYKCNNTRHQIQYVNDEIIMMKFNDSIDIRIPNMFEDFCNTFSICCELTDFEIVILDYGSGNVFTNEVDKEDLPDRVINYSIGAYISNDENNIFYWFFIY
jgi:hypothetical protein